MTPWDVQPVYFVSQPMSPCELEACEWEVVEMTVTHRFCAFLCFCGRTFSGRDERRVMQHMRHHQKRCTRAKRMKRLERQRLAAPEGQEPTP